MRWGWSRLPRAAILQPPNCAGVFRVLIFAILVPMWPVTAQIRAGVAVILALTLPTIEESRPQATRFYFDFILQNWISMSRCIHPFQPDVVHTSSFLRNFMSFLKQIDYLPEDTHRYRHSCFTRLTWFQCTRGQW